MYVYMYICIYVYMYMYVYIYIYIYTHYTNIYYKVHQGEPLVLTLLVQRLISSNVANHPANCGDPRHNARHVKQTRPH